MSAPHPSPVVTSFNGYAAVLTSSGWAPNGNLEAVSERPPRSIRIARALVPKSRRDQVKATLTHAVSMRSRRRVAALLAGGEDIRLHLGCGPNHLDGWTNIDLVSTGSDLPWDLSRGNPFPDDSVAAVFHEHLMEHLPLPAAIPFLRECRRVLRPGGVLRVGVPDFGRYARDYAGERKLIGTIRPGRPTALMALSELAFCYGHASMWDEETLLGALREVGFEAPEKRGYRETAIRPIPDSAWREPETLYAEAVK
jgi:predicted SAM-dependent methyltransferase